MEQTEFENKVSKLKKAEILHLWQAGVITVEGFKRTLKVNQSESIVNRCFECHQIAKKIGFINY